MTEKNRNTPAKPATQLHPTQLHRAPAHPEDCRTARRPTGPSTPPSVRPLQTAEAKPKPRLPAYVMHA